ncbi:unnamed protein product [Trichobilharzia regenti]|nr:unnamed protein product [Trichobilharzia regenti]
MKKLATTYLNCTVNSNATASSSSNENLISKSIQPSTSLPVISTLGLIPKLYCMHNDYLNNLHSSSYSSSSSSYKMKLNESSNLQYSLRLVLNSQLLLINRTGIDLHLKLPSMKSDMPSSSTSPSSAAATAATTIKRVISLKDKESVALAQNQVSCLSFIRSKKVKR